MKLSIIMLVLIGGYTFMLIASANVVLDQAQQLQMAYQRADRIAAEAVASSR